LYFNSVTTQFDAHPVVLEKHVPVGQVQTAMLWLLLGEQPQAPVRHPSGKSPMLAQHVLLLICPPLDVHNSANPWASGLTWTSTTPPSVPLVPPLPVIPPVLPPSPPFPPLPLLPPTPTAPSLPIALHPTSGEKQLLFGQAHLATV